MSPPHVLIVDDERRNRMLLEAMLAPEEFTLSTAGSGEEALASVAKDPPDLILLDVLMPGMGGYEVADTLKRDLATRHIPIIMVSALDDHGARMSGLTAGAEDFLTRPVDRAELCIRVRNLLRLKAASDVAIAERDTSMGMVSHDLRNLLHGIVLQATMLAEADADAEIADVRRAAGLKRILDHATRMGRLVEDLVDVVRINAGKLALESAPHDAVTLLADTLDAFAADAAKRGVALRVDPGASTLVATFDRARVLQVLGNLVTNAIKFTPRGGAIVLHGERAVGELRFSVRDTGAGIPAALLDTVFERFQQVGERDQRGLGLGLYISRCIVESHGGRLWVDSTLGVGSTFCFTIPDGMARAPDAAAGWVPSTPSVPAPAPSAPPTTTSGLAQRLRVLIVDDDPAMGETLATCLSRRGFEAMSRTSTHDAVTLVESIAFDVIVTDLHMDGLDGLGLCAWVARARPGLPVIVTTGFGGAETRAEAVRAGAFEFLTKPVDVDLLRATVERACAARSPDRG